MTDAKHEAPADTVTISRAEYDVLKSGYPGDPSLLHEAPAEGAGEQCVKVCPQCEGEGEYADGVDEAACSTPCTRCGSNGWIVDLAALRARSSAPEAREDGYRRVDLGMVATTIETMHRRIEELTGSRQSQYDGAVSLARDLYLTAAPSADKLRIADGAMHTALMERIHEEIVNQHPDAFTEDGDIERIIPSGCTPQSAFVKIDVSALADVALAALKAEG